ncbi:putative multicopper oxidase, type 1 [Lophiotrema nucula]|uniref:Putative multicopper oxidase, type 1 n=1 Tax=Lophiotrema nucula TaxID=690887 RepID=A0A6A5YSU9_9PLEO|nr:putative multicopper oxidase, type 1 [Lophiotrema nucula]
MEELEWEPKASQSRWQRWRASWLRIVVIGIVVIWTLGFILHSFFASRKTSTTPSELKTAILRPEEDYILDPEWKFDAGPAMREYRWTITDAELNPDGVYRPMILINGMFPGPLIECNEGDSIVVHVHNEATNATSIHWHGLYQNGTNWMDGTIGITQCPIAPGQSLTYRFDVEGQSGTYWYHSHMSVQASDGLYGPIVIHAKNEKELQKVPYEEDRVVMVSDHYYDLSSSLMMQYLAPDNENSEPVPPSALIDGRNVRDCSKLPGRRCDAANLSNTLFDLPSDKNTRLRIINAGAFAEFQLQIDEHEFSITEVDGTDVHPQSIHRLNINPAQRYSIILTPPNPNKGLYWMRARMITHCFAYENPELQEAEVRAIIRYWAPGTSLTPESLDWPEIIEVECRDLNTSALEPVEAIAAPDKADDQIYLRSNFEIGAWKLSRGFLNSSSYRSSPSSPSLNRLVDGYSKREDKYINALESIPYGINSAVFDSKTELVYQTTGIRTIDILIQNFDDGNHPFHLHGYKFFVLAQGHGYPPKDLYSNLNLTNPLRRDTASVEHFGWTLIRFVADNSGIWAFHCHISWHSEAGLLMQFLTRADEVVKWTLPDDVKDLCKAEGIEKGMGPDDSIWAGSTISP